MANRRKIALAFVALVTLVASVTLTFSSLNGSIQSGLTQAAGVTATDYYIPTSFDPWGTTFDSKGNVWLAIPGCDPSPTCSSTTPPGYIAEFKPTYSAWPVKYQLPSGYGQALFLAFDAQGQLWFASPMSNSIGRLNPASFPHLTLPNDLSL